MIQLENIKFQYPQSEFVLNIDQMTFPGGSKTAVIGPSGFGKTTMLNMIAGILLPQQGKVNVADATVNQLSDSDRRNFRIRNIGFVFQDFRLIPYLTVLDNILLTFKINNYLKPEPDSIDKAKALAADLNIDRLIKKYPAKLSHGERQRVAIARALINNPKVILADEPTGNLDPANKEHIKNLLFAAIEKFDATLVTVTHDHEMLKGYDDVIDFKELRKGELS
jgi:putative ABC transport system ATP-binding protein